MENSQIVYNYYKAKGFNNNQIAGIMGNIQQESDFDTTATNDGSGAYGIFQWLGSRKTELQKFAQERGTSSDDLLTQLEFSWHEMNTTEKKTLNMLNENKYSSARTIARLFESSYERSGGSAVAKRQNYAAEWMNSFGGAMDGGIDKGQQFKDGIDSITDMLESDVTSNDIDLTLSGNILKFTSILLVAVLCVVFLVLTLKKTAMSGVVDMGKDILKDTLKGVSKGGGEK